MNTFLLDTDIISLIQFGHVGVVKRLAMQPVSQVFLSVLSLQEQMRGWLARLGKLKKPDQLADWYERYVTRMFPIWRRHPLLTFSLGAISRFEVLRGQRLNVGLMDLRIAAVALESGLTVVTRNTTDFGRVPGLVVEDWSV